MILNAHIDDSGSDENSDPPSKFFVLAGYVLTVDDWKRFSDEWVQQLHRLPQIKTFKMADAEYGDGNFLGMQEPFRKLKVNELADVIDKFSPTPIPISAHLRWDQYSQIVKGNVHPKIDSPYAILFYQVMRVIHEVQIDVNRTDPSFGFHQVDFIFDDQGRIGLRALQWYEGLRSIVPDPYATMMGSTPIFRDDEKVVALQSADMVAWHIHRYLERPGEIRPVSEKIFKLHRGVEVTEETLREFVENAKRINPDELDRGL